MKIYPVVKPNLSSVVKQYLYRYIRSVKVDENMKLPPETEISANLGVSRVTVRRALDEMEKEGVVLRIHGRGTFINPEALKIQVNLFPGEEFMNLIRSCGYTPSCEVADLRKREVDEETANIMHLEPGTEIYEVEKVFYADDCPAIISIDRFDAEVIGGNLKPEDFKAQSTFDLIKQKAGSIIVRDKIRMETMDHECATEIVPSVARMECKSVLVFHGINYNQDNQPVIYDTEFYDTNYIKFSFLRVKNVYND